MQAHPGRIIRDNQAQHQGERKHGGAGALLKPQGRRQADNGGCVGGRHASRRLEDHDMRHHSETAGK